MEKVFFLYKSFELLKNKISYLKKLITKFTKKEKGTIDIHIHEA